MIRADQSHVGICQIIAFSSTQTAYSQRRFEKFSECLLHVIQIIKAFLYFDWYNFYPKYSPIARSGHVPTLRKYI